MSYCRLRVAETALTVGGSRTPVEMLPLQDAASAHQMIETGSVPENLFTRLQTASLIA